MPRTILIVDDEPQFNFLLTEIYRQGGYRVFTAASGLEGLALLKRESVDLVVTDYRMPGMSGLDFIREITSLHEAIPMIMVSGYLDNSTVRELIAHGVGGVFMKPLNVSALLNKTAELLADFEDARGASPAGEQPSAGSVAPFWLFPSVARASLEFVRKAKGYVDFSRVLSIVGEPGTDFDRICTELVRSDRRAPVPVFLDAAEVSRGGLDALVRQRKQGGDGEVTLVVRDPDSLTPSQKEALYALIAPAESSREERSIRIIFIFLDSVDACYDAGAIDEDFYVFLGTNELVVPPLRLIPEDIELLAQAVLAEIRPGLVLGDTAVAALAGHPFPGNMAQLKALLLEAAQRCNGSVLEKDDLDMGSVAPSSPAARDFGGDEGHGLKLYLRDRRDDLVTAAMILGGGEAARAAAMLEVDPVWLEQAHAALGTGAPDLVSRRNLR